MEQPHLTQSVETLPSENDSERQLFEEYLQKLQAIPAHTLNLSSEEQALLPERKRVTYQEDTAQFEKLQNQNKIKSPENQHGQLLAHIIEELLARHNTLCQDWANMKGNPRVLKTNPPDDLHGIDFIFSFSENISCATDITIAKEGSEYQEKKLRRQQYHEKTFRRASLEFWRFPNGAIAHKEFPFLLIYIPAKKIRNFLKTSITHLSQPLETSYQNQYKIFFSDILSIAAEKAEEMAMNMLESGLARGYLSADLVEHINAITKKHETSWDRANAIKTLTLNKLFQEEAQKKYLGLLVQYYIIHSTARITAKRLKKNTKKQ